MKTYKNNFADLSFKTFYITDNEEAQGIVSTFDPARLHGLDIETAKKDEFKAHPNAGLCPHLSSIRLLQVYNGKNTYVFDMWEVDIKILKDFLSKGRFVAHFAVFELLHFTMAGIPNMNVGCSMLLSQMVDAAEHSPFEADPIPGEEDEDDTDQTGLAIYKRTGHSLDAVTQRLFGYKVDKHQQTSNWNAEVLSAEQISYAGLDAILTYNAATVLARRLKEHKMERAYKLLKDMQHIVVKMQIEGLPVDWDYHAGLMQGWSKESQDAFAACEPFFGTVNMRSGKQMNAWLIEYLKDKPGELENWPRTKSGKGFAFSRTAIGSFKHLPAINALLNFKKYAKLLDTYGESLLAKRHPLTGRLHTSYTLGQTRTGRLSSRDPNIQNFPRDADFRSMFRAAPNHVLVVSDFSQIELRLQAEFSQDPTMLQIYKNKSDIYKVMAASPSHSPCVL